MGVFPEVTMVVTFIFRSLQQRGDKGGGSHHKIRGKTRGKIPHKTSKGKIPHKTSKGKIPLITCIESSDFDLRASCLQWSCPGLILS